MSRTKCHQRGYVLLPVVLALSLIALIAFMMNRNSAITIEMTAGAAETDQARYVAEAGLHHALWQVQNAGCSGYADLPATSFGSLSYSATVTPTAGSPVSIVATGSLANGVTRTLARSGVRVTDRTTTQTIRLQPVADTYILQERPGENSGQRDFLVTNSETAGRGPVRSLLRFDLSAIPAGAVITEARLKLFLDEPNRGAADVVEAHRLTRAWIEGTGSPNSGASWTRYDGINRWSSPGADGDYDPQLAGSFVASGEEEWKNMDLTALTQAWVEGAYANNGLILLSAPNSGNNLKIYCSREEADQEDRPKLIVTFVCECGVDCSAGGTSPGYYRDEFNNATCTTAVDYSGSDGTLDWSGQSWTEVGETDNSCSGEVKLVTDLGDTSLRMNMSGEGIERAVDLSMFTTAALWFEYRRQSMESSDFLSVGISADGGATWTELGQISGSATDSDYQREGYDIGAFISGNTLIRFLPSFSSTSDYIYIDNIQIDDGSAGPPPLSRTVALTPVADTYIEEESPDKDYGTDEKMKVGMDQDYFEFRALVRFDVSGIPAGSTVTSATLRLYKEKVKGGGTYDFGVYTVTASWSENTATWGNTGWGGTFDPSPLVINSVSLVEDQWQEWALPEGLIHEWIDGMSPNYGLLLKYEGTQVERYIEASSRENGTSAWRPQLVIQYLEP